jgi:hypothetical protein
MKWIRSLVFGLLLLGRSHFDHCKGTEMDLVLGFWSLDFSFPYCPSHILNWSLVIGFIFFILSLPYFEVRDFLSWTCTPTFGQKKQFEELRAWNAAIWWTY